MINRFLLITACAIASASFADETGHPILTVPAAQVVQAGTLPEGIEDGDVRILSNEPTDANGSVVFVFDLEDIKFQSTPMVKLRFVMAKVKVRRAGEKSQPGRGALHAFLPAIDSRIAGSAPVKPGLTVPYVIDITGAVSEALARPEGERTLRVEVRMTGEPAYYEVYGLVEDSEHGPAKLEIASPENWTNDWAQRLKPLDAPGAIYREGCMAITENPGTEVVVPLLFPAKRITEVIHNGTGENLEEGRDWILRDGSLVLTPGTRAPVQNAVDFFVHEKKNEDGTVTRRPSTIRLVEGTFYHERQIEVSYEPDSRDWELPAAVSKPGDLPRTQRLLSEKAPLKMLLFGDSISYGGNASKVEGGWPWQPAFGELVAWDLERRSGSEVTFMNHSRGGSGVTFAASQATSQVGWFRPDLVILGYGMNDRREERRAIYKETLEEIIDTIREDSPATEFIIVTSMLNNPMQSTGLESILELRDLALSVERPGLAFVDMTSVHKHLIERKNYLDTSGNGANHPNDYLQRIYAQQVLRVLMPDTLVDTNVSAYTAARSQLPTIAKKAKNNKDINVAYIGGSITNGGGQHGYRAHLTQMLQAATQGRVTEINAAVSGTGSMFASQRFDRDVLVHDLDLLVVEFGVNDHVDSSEWMERIVRKTWTHQPEADILFVYTFAVDRHSSYYDQGKNPPSIASHERVAEHYGIPSIHMGRFAYDSIRNGRLTELEFAQDGIHPSALGYSIFNERLSTDLPLLMQSGKRSSRVTRLELPEPLTANFELYPSQPDTRPLNKKVWQSATRGSSERVFPLPTPGLHWQGAPRFNEAGEPPTWEIVAIPLNRTLPLAADTTRTPPTDFEPVGWLPEAAFFHGPSGTSIFESIDGSIHLGSARSEVGVIVFTAPKDGIYEGIIRIAGMDFGGTDDNRMNLHTLHLPWGKQTGTTLSYIERTKGAVEPLEEHFEIEMLAGERVLFIPAKEGRRQRAHWSGLEIELAAFPADSQK